MFYKSDKVFDIRYGWGVVSEITPVDKYCVKVIFAVGEPVFYNKQGKDYENDETGLLRHYEYKLIGKKKVRA